MESAKKVLLVEDNPGDARLLNEALIEVQPAPFALVHVDRFITAIEALKRETFSAVLLDLSLPDAKGLDTVVRMQREADAVPIVVLTGLDDDSTALEAVRAGAQDYLIKGEIDGKLLVRSLSYAMERKRLQEATAKHLNHIVILKDINAALTSTLELSDVLDTLLEKVTDVMPQVAVTIRLRDKESAQLEPVACRNIDEPAWRAATLRWQSRGIMSDAATAQNGLLLINDAANDPRAGDPEFCRLHGFTAYLGIPFMVNDQILGLLALYAKEQRQFSDDEFQFLSALAGQASVAIHNSQAHGEIIKLAKDLERANHVKDEFLSVMSHELRTPLNVARGYLEMLQSGFFGEVCAEQRGPLDKIAAQHRVQLGMVNNILNAIAMESEVAAAHYEVVVLSDFFDELQNVYPQPLDGKVEFCWDCPHDLPMVKSDKTKLQYIMQNLINNAIKFTPEGSITVSAKVEGLDGLAALPAGKCNLVMSVADTGAGIADEFQSVIFEKFSQVDSSNTRVHDGIGLGLHIVKRCAALLQGKIKVESELGKGTVFTVCVPCEV
jgi:signal transduction histidine kinase/CheY-like chemotaxis protein